MDKESQTVAYHKTKMQKEMILEKLRNQGCRITKQRLIIIDIILSDECSCCKEIYYKASKIDSKIGTATVYRMINTLEEIGAISRKNMYRVVYDKDCPMKNCYTITLDDDTVYKISTQKWDDIIKAGLARYGYLHNQNVVSVTVNKSETELHLHSKVNV